MARPPRPPKLRSDPAATYREAAQRFQAGDLKTAERLCTLLLAQMPKHADGLFLAAAVASTDGRAERAIELLDRFLAQRPDHGDAQRNRAQLLQRVGRIADAIAAYERVAKKDPTAENLVAYGNALLKAVETQRALAAFEAAVARDPQSAAAHRQRGTALLLLGRLEAATAAYRQSTVLDPASVAGWVNLAGALVQGRNRLEGIACYRRALSLEPQRATAAAALLHELQHACDWSGMAEVAAIVERQTTEALAQNRLPVETPFANVVRVDDPLRNLAIARATAADIERRMAGLGRRIALQNDRDPARRLRIGYLSADFGIHATMHLMRSFFALHDRADFEVAGYSIGKADSSDYRREVEASFDRFVDLAAEGVEAAAHRIAADRIDILVDLKGHTSGNRMEILALRPAPLQVAWLGFPGTTGARFIDYAVVDRVILPPDEAATFTEALCYLPDCYQVTDAGQPIADGPASRAELGLAEDGFVLASFNQAYKLEPAMFDLWADLLKAIPRSVLWLWRSNDAMEANLRRETEARGLGPDRLVFAPGMAKPQHLRRLALADLGLDTRICNGHTTTTDMLWAGLPVVALRGRHLASRVSASLLGAVGLPELLAEDLEGYRARVLHYAQEPDALAALRAKLAANRTTAPLFDTPRLARNLEAIYRTIWRRHCAGEPPSLLMPPAAPAAEGDACKD